MPVGAGWSAIPPLLVLPLALGGLSLVLRPAAVRRLVWPGLALVLLAAAGLTAQVLAFGPQRYAVGGWRAPLGIELYADGLSALMLLMTALIGLFASIYARAYFARHPGSERFWPLWWLLWAAMNGLYLAADVFNAYVALELLGLSAVGLVALDRSAGALSAGLRYLLATLFGSLFYLLGVALLYGAHGTLAMAELAALIRPGPLSAATLGLMTVGLLIKAALFPMHVWLPPAHGSAPPPVSAVLSGLVSKVAFYLVLRLWFDLFEAAPAPAAAQTLGMLGAAAVLWGSVAAVRQRKLKMLVAYSTVAQIGYLFLLFPLATATAPEVAAQAWSGGLFYALSHAFAKAAMFLAAGTIVHAWGEDDIEHLEGTSARLPVSLFAFGIAGVTLMGLPPSGGFIGKWLLLRSAIEAAQWWWAVVLLAGGLFTAVYVFRVLRSAFVPAHGDRPLHPIPAAMQLSAFVLALLSLGLGLVAPGPLGLLEIGAGEYR